MMLRASRRRTTSAGCRPSTSNATSPAESPADIGVWIFTRALPDSPALQRSLRLRMRAATRAGPICRCMANAAAIAHWCS